MKNEGTHQKTIHHITLICIKLFKDQILKNENVTKKILIKTKNPKFLSHSSLSNVFWVFRKKKNGSIKNDYKTIKKRTFATKGIFFMKNRVLKRGFL